VSDSGVSGRRVGVLSNLTAPLLPLLLQELYAKGLSDLVVIFDSRALGAKDLGIFQQRTRDAFDDPGVTLHDFADRALPFYFVRNHNGPDGLALVRKLDCALLINGGTPRKLGPEMLAAARQGVINVHPGVLPKYRGASCVEWAIYNDEAVGNTAHFMTEGYDEGPIIKVESYRFPASSDYVDIRVRVYREAQRLMAETVADVLDRGLTAADCPAQPEGSTFRPIPDDKLQEAIRRIEEKRYSFLDAE
jgi:methionyl-tRNA formyltransferase